MIKIREIRISDYEYCENSIDIQFVGRVNVNEMIPELIKLVEKWENKDAGNKNNNNN